MANIVYVLQVRWLGGDDWANGIFVAKTNEEARAKALEALKQTLRETAADDAEREESTWDPKFLEELENIDSIPRLKEWLKTNEMEDVMVTGWFVQV